MKRRREDRQTRGGETETRELPEAGLDPERRGGTFTGCCCQKFEPRWWLQLAITV